ncbi:outer membrane protein assembly factor BamB family protein, partial [Streptomyces sp. S6]
LWPALPKRRRRPAPRLGGRRRASRRLVLALATGAVGLSVFMWAANADNSVSSDGEFSESSPQAALPDGWLPWRADLTRAVTAAEETRMFTLDRPGCVADKAAVYCTGTGFTVARLDAATGRVMWRSGVTPQAARPIGVRDGLVYVYESPNTGKVATGTDTPQWQLIALDAATGERRWSRSAEATEPAVLFDGGGLLALSAGHRELIGIDSRTGKDLWRASTKSTAGSRCTPLVLGGAPYGLCQDEDDPAKRRWSLLHVGEKGSRELTTLPPGAVPLGVLGGQALFAEPKEAGSPTPGGLDEAYTALLRVDPVNGTTLGRTAFDQTVRGTATLVGSTVYFVRPDGTATAVAEADGTTQWQADTQVENLSKPVWSRTYDALLLVNRYGRLVSLDLSSGTVGWTTDKLQDPAGAPENIVPSLVLVGDAIVAVAGDTAFSVSPDSPDLTAEVTGEPSPTEPSLTDPSPTEPSLTDASSTDPYPSSASS